MKNNILLINVSVMEKLACINSKECGSVITKLNNGILLLPCNGNNEKVIQTVIEQYKEERGELKMITISYILMNNIIYIFELKGINSDILIIASSSGKIISF